MVVKIPGRCRDDRRRSRDAGRPADLGSRPTTSDAVRISSHRTGDGGATTLAAPVRARRRCLFAVSCSHHVEAALRAAGLRAAWQALHTRLTQCRPGYVFVLSPAGPGGIADLEGPAMRCVDGTLVPIGELSPSVVAEWQAVESCLAWDR